MRGLFTAGVLDVLYEEGVRFDGMVGVSAGALFGCNFKSGQVGRALRYNVRFAGDPRYMSWRSLLRTGNFINKEFAFHEVPMILDVFDMQAFDANPMEFYLVCTDIEKGVPYYKHVESAEDNIMEWFRATGALPVLSRPVELEGMKLLDGGITDCIPLQFFQQMGYERNVVILTQPLGYRKKPTRLGPLFRLVHRKYPKVAECMARRHLMYNAQLDYIQEQAKLGNTLLVYPDEPLQIGRTEADAKKMQQVYEAGREKGDWLIHNSQFIIDFVELFDLHN